MIRNFADSIFEAILYICIIALFVCILAKCTFSVIYWFVKWVVT